MKANFLLILILSLILTVACESRSEFESQASEVFPPVEINHAALSRMDQLPITPAFFDDQWTVLAFASYRCESDCQQSLQLLNQQKQAQSLLVIDDLASHKVLRQLASEYPSVAISMGATAVSIDNFIMQFDIEEIEPENKKYHLYVIGPDRQLLYSLPLEQMTVEQLENELKAFKGQN